MTRMHTPTRYPYVEWLDPNDFVDAQLIHLGRSHRSGPIYAMLHLSEKHSAHLRAGETVSDWRAKTDDWREDYPDAAARYDQVADYLQAHPEVLRPAPTDTAPSTQNQEPTS